MIVVGLEIVATVVWAIAQTIGAIASLLFALFQVIFVDSIVVFNRLLIVLIALFVATFIIARALTKTSFVVVVVFLHKSMIDRQRLFSTTPFPCHFLTKTAVILAQSLLQTSLKLAVTLEKLARSTFSLMTTFANLIAQMTGFFFFLKGLFASWLTVQGGFQFGPACCKCCIFVFIL